MLKEKALEVSVVIVTYNRCEVLGLVLDKFRKIDFPDLEIIVVDNASSDETVSMLEGKFKEVKLIKLEKNLGYEAYDIGLAKAKGKYIIFMDNDAFLKENSLERLVKEFNDKPDIDVIAMNIMIYGTDISETEAWQADTPIFHGATVAMKKAVLDDVGGYDKDYFIVHTDLELATRILNRGYRIVYDDKIIAYHLRSDKARSKVTSIYYSTRNALFYYWKYYPLFYTLRLSSREVIYGFIRGVREKCLYAYFKGLGNGLFAIPKMLRKRMPLKKELYLRLRHYLDTQFREPLIKKIFAKLKNG
jgi:hypothetical protein